MRNMDRTCRVLRLVESALREIDEKTFGVCADCGESIPLKRLEAVPWSPLCVKCQERAEGWGDADTYYPYALAS
jgi:DnaK suppressor protein